MQNGTKSESVKNELFKVSNDERARRGETKH